MLDKLSKVPRLLLSVLELVCKNVVGMETETNLAVVFGPKSRGVGFILVQLQGEWFNHSRVDSTICYHLARTHLCDRRTADQRTT